MQGSVLVETVIVGDGFALVCYVMKRSNGATGVCSFLL